MNFGLFQTKLSKVSERYLCVVEVFVMEGFD